MAENDDDNIVALFFQIKPFFLSLFLSFFLAIYDMSSKIDFNSQYKITELHATPLCMDFW